MKTRELKVHKSNDLIEASYKLSLQEQRIILLMISMLNPYKEKEFQTIRISIQEFMELVGVTGKSKYDDVMSITKKLRERTLLIKKPESDLIIGWLSSAEYFKGKGYVELEFSPKMKPYLLQLQELYTPYNLKDIIKLRLSYSVRIYELCKQYQMIGERTFPLEELKRILGIVGDKYKLYADFKRRVVTPVVKELNKSTDLSIMYEEKKEGKRVATVKFVFCKKGITTKEKFTPEGTNPELFKRLTTYFLLSKAQANSVMEKYSEGRLKRNLSYAEKKYKEGGVENIGAYTLKCIKDDISDQKSLFKEEEREKDILRIRAQMEEQQLEDLERNYYIQKEKAAEDYLSTLSEIEIEKIRDEINRETKSQYGIGIGYEVMSKRAFIAKMAELARFPLLEEWMETEKAKMNE
ncbi:MAG: replication initiation protein [Leadbetterella sp.]|nr:replication initiation protein [Leadbetterella sp.]